MSIYREPQCRKVGRSELAEYQNTIRTKAPALGRLLDMLDAGTTPTFLDILSAISENVALYTEGDQIESEECLTFSVMSGKFCRFCS